MAEDGTVNSQNPALNGASGPQAGLISQYVKDLSVENPNAPDSFQWPGQLSFDVQFRAESRQLSEEVHEMVCTYTIAAKAEQGTAYLVELAYGALVGIRGMDEEQVRRFLRGHFGEDGHETSRTAVKKGASPTRLVTTSQ